MIRGGMVPKKASDKVVSCGMEIFQATDSQIQWLTYIIRLAYLLRRIINFGIKVSNMPIKTVALTISLLINLLEKLCQMISHFGMIFSRTAPNGVLKLTSK